MARVEMPPHQGSAARVETPPHSGSAARCDDATIEYVGILAQLDLSSEEKEAAKRDMDRMLQYIDRLNELDTTGVEPMSHVFPHYNVFREDVVENSNDRDNILKNVPVSSKGAFKVPKTID